MFQLAPALPALPSYTRVQASLFWESEPGARVHGAVAHGVHGVQGTGAGMVYLVRVVGT